MKVSCAVLKESWGGAIPPFDSNLALKGADLTRPAFMLFECSWVHLEFTFLANRFVVICCVQQSVQNVYQHGTIPLLIRLQMQQ